MTALVGLGLRLARAGGRLRAWSIAVGNAVGVVLLLAAVALPAAIYPDPRERADNRVQLLALLLFLMIPGTILLITAGRLSSGVRDRRLAALRMIGVSPSRVRLVAAVENGSLALAGAVAGAGTFAAIARPAGAAIGRGTGWFEAPLQVPVVMAALVVLAVTALSVLVGTAATWERGLPGAARSESTRRRLSPARLAPLALGLAALVWLANLDDTSADPVLMAALLLGGGVLTAVGIAQVTPLVTAWASGPLVRSRSIAATLAGRAMQIDAAGASRTVAGLSVAVFLVVAALGTLGAMVNTPQNRYATQVLGDGPQKIMLWAGQPGSGARLDKDDLASLSAVPGVRGAIPHVAAQVDCGDAARNDGCAQVFVGTCAQLALGYDVSGCDDSHAARIVADDAGFASGEGVGLPASADGAPLALVLVLGVADGARVGRTVPLAADPIAEDVQGTLRTWVYSDGLVAFVPIAAVHDAVGDPEGVDVVADGGTAVQQRVIAWAAARGHTAQLYPVGDLDQVRAVRVVVWTLCGIALGVALLVLALTTADRALERRRNVARQVAIGMPARVLRAGQFLQVLVPLVVAVALALGAGAVLLRAYVHVAGTSTGGYGTGSRIVRGLSELHGLIEPGSWVALGTVVLAGAALVALSTVPLIRTRISADLLRRE